MTDLVRKSIYTGVGAGTGISLYDLIMRRRKKKSSLLGRALSGVAGGIAGRWIYRAFNGTPYDNADFDPNNIKSGDTVNVIYTGAGDGASGYLYNNVKTSFDPTKTIWLRWNDREKADALLKQLPAGVKQNVIGYSWGGKSANRHAKDYNAASVHLIDPVSWFGRSLANNATVHTPEQSYGSSYKYDPSNLIADIGGRWNYRGKNSVTYRGGHTEGVSDVFRELGGNNQYI